MKFLKILNKSTVLRNIVKSLRFTKSILYPVAPIVGENVAKLCPIEGNTTDLGILHFFTMF
jgi:hypothetical protein